jgi:translation initiation factor 5
MPFRGGTVINISGATPVDDPEYRYKMPAVFGKIEGSGNGIKTAIPNITDVGLSLHRPPGEVNKFFGCELGAQTTYNEDTDRAIVNGAHTDDTLQKLMHRYIEGFVLCPVCRYPETEYKIKNEIIWHRCAACGAKEMVDMAHKLCNYILAQKKKKDKKNGKGKKKDKKKGKGKDDSDDDKKKKKDKKKDKKDKKKDKKESEDDDDKEYLKEAAFGKNEEEIIVSDDDNSSVASEAGVDDEGAMSKSLCLKQLCKYLEFLLLTNFFSLPDLAVQGTKKYLADNPNASVGDIVELVTNQQMASALKAHDKIHIFIRAAITPQFFKNKQIEKYAPVAIKIANGNKIIERHLIASLEFISIEKPKNFPVLIKQFYDEDGLEEQTILEWSEDGRSEFTVDAVDEETRAALRGEAEPVVVWLQEADSEDESDED